MGKCINWKEIPTEFVSFEEYKYLLENDTEGEETPPLPGCKCVLDIFRLNWYVQDNILYYWSKSKKMFRKITPNEEWEQKEKERLGLEPTPMEDFMKMCSMVKDTYKMTLKDRYGCADKKLWGFVKCVPSQISWYNKRFTGKIIPNIFKADVSSAFPYEACKRLPTLKDHKIVYGYEVEPTEEYPFVFYSDGRLVILEKDGTIVDTDDFTSSPFYKKIMAEMNYSDKAYEYDYPVYEKELLFGYKKCLCCKAAPSLKEIMEEIYEEKKSGNKHAKLLMNRFIGYCWHKCQPSYFHLTAVIIARCDNRIVEMARRLLGRGCMPLLIATDSIMWKGEDDEIKELIKPKDENTQLGDLCWEAYDAEAAIMGSKCYQVKHSNGTLSTVWSGTDRRESKKLSFGDILKENPGDFFTETTEHGKVISFPMILFED